MENLSDTDLKKIVDEVVSSLTREMPSQISSAASQSIVQPGSPTGTKKTENSFIGL